MYQHARQRQRNAEATRRASVEPAHTPVVGKRTLTEGLAAPAAGEHVLDTVKRELRAVGSVALPAYLVIAERTDLDPVAKQIQLADAAAQVRHLLMTARQQLAALEKLAPDRGVMLATLREELDVLAVREVRAGTYRGAEDTLPRPHGTSTKVDDRSRVATPVAPVAPVAAVAAVVPVVPVAPQRPPAASVHAVQRKVSGTAYARDVQAVAARGVASASAPLPHLATIQRAFGRHDVSNVRVQIGGAAAQAAQAIGAKAYATGNTIAFASEPDLHTAAHEAAHVIQQRRGVALAEGIDGGRDDAHERHADDVADAVVSGRSAEALLGPTRSTQSVGPPAIQRKPGGDSTYTLLSINTQERKLPRFPKLSSVEATWKGKLQGSIKNAGALGAKHRVAGRESETRFLSSDAAIEYATKKLDAKLQAELAKNATRILDGEAFNLSIPVSVQIETKALDAAISFRKLDFKLATVTFIFEGDFTTASTRASVASWSRRSAGERSVRYSRSSSPSTT